MASRGTAQRTGIHSLPDDVLRRVLAFVAPASRAKAGRVCKRWDRLISEPQLWQRLIVSWDHSRDPAGVSDFDAANRVREDALELGLQNWLRKRCSAAHELHVRLSSKDENLDKDRCVRDVLLAVASAPTLQQLHLLCHRTCCGVSISTSTLARVQLLRGLTALHIGCLAAPVRGMHLETLFGNLPQLQECTLAFTGFRTSHLDSDQDAAAFLAALLRCRQLTSLEVRGTGAAADAAALDWGGLPGISALRQLRHLKLQGCITQQLAPAISGLTALTCLGVCCEQLNPEVGPHLDPDQEADEDLVQVPHPLPATVTALTALRCLDITEVDLLPELLALTGLQDLTLRPATARVRGKMLSAEWAQLSSLRQLTRLQLIQCGLSNGPRVQGCTALLDLTMANCNLLVLPALNFYSQLTRLCVAGNTLPEETLVNITLSLPRLVTFDISRMRGLRMSASCSWELLAQRCPNLRRVYCQLVNSLLPAEADTIVRVQRAAPHLRWYFNESPSLEF